MYTDPEQTVQTYTDHEPNAADFPPILLLSYRSTASLRNISFTKTRG